MFFIYLTFNYKLCYTLSKTKTQSLSLKFILEFSTNYDRYSFWLKPIYYKRIINFWWYANLAVEICGTLKIGFFYKKTGNPHCLTNLATLSRTLRISKWLRNRKIIDTLFYFPNIKHLVQNNHNSHKFGSNEMYVCCFCWILFFLLWFSFILSFIKH